MPQTPAASLVINSGEALRMLEEIQLNSRTELDHEAVVRLIHKYYGLYKKKKKVMKNKPKEIL